MSDDEVNCYSPAYLIRCTNMPIEFFKDTSKAKRYFGNFGKIRLVMFKRKLQTCLVEYSNEESMLNALENAGNYNGQIFKVTRDEKQLIRKKRHPKRDPEWIPDPEVKAELEAMSGVGFAKKYNLRPEGMQVGPVETKDNKPAKLKRPWKSESTVVKKAKKIKANLLGQESELLGLIKTQALTVEEKYRVLDARDKLIRLRLKDVDFNRGGPTVGICPDMCPEKERLMRETQHQVAVYEQGDSAREMNAKLAVKQYSRSSANQEFPLPQELRPVGVLQMTMGYLMHRIMNLCDSGDVNLAEWYHFLWDRTRGIRKDITQQALCCPGSVALVEQCARFHIFCSARLVAEDPSVFDQKINTENLTKCLQTLKYMYHDLGLKRISCKNEAEFRAYIILLNLNDGNFMWEVQQLRPEIQHSRQVRFALEVYSAIDKNNYVKFFQLVKRTTFLNACILMRYFTQIRQCATRIFLKCFSPRATQVLLPLNDFAKLLAFENIESSIEFIETYGLYTNDERTHIILDKRSFSLPEYPYVLDRAINLVESKRNASVGEVVNAGKLAEIFYEKHVPQNSFDERGFLINFDYHRDFDDDDMDEKIYGEKPLQPPIDYHRENQDFQELAEGPPYITGEQGEQEEAEEQEFREEEEQNYPEEEQEYSEEREYHEGQEYREEQEYIGEDQEFPEEGEGKQEFSEDDDQEMPQERELFKKQDEPDYPFRLHPKTIVDPLKEKEEEFRRKQQELEAKLKEKLEEQHKLIELRKKEIEMEEKRKLEERQKMEQQRQKQITELKLKEIQKGVQETMLKLLDEVEEKLRSDKLKTIGEAIQRRKLKNFLRIWQDNMTFKKEKRKNMDFSPILFSDRTVGEEAKELETAGQKYALAEMKRYRAGYSLDIEIDCEKTQPLDLPQLTYDNLLKRLLSFKLILPQEIYWKLTISMPVEMKLKYGLNKIETFFDEYINWTNNLLLQQYKKDKILTYCVEKQKGNLVGSKYDSMGFIFIAMDLDNELLERISLNLKKFGLFAQIPIVVILAKYTQNEDKLNLLRENNIISDYLLIVDKDDFKASLNEGFKFLADNYPKPPPLEMDTFKSFLTRHLCTEIWRKANSFAKWNSNYKDCLKEPNIVIFLYNEALNRLKQIVLDKSNSEWPRFPRIFQNTPIPDFLPCDYRYFPTFWDHELYLNKIKLILDNLHLPKLVNWPCVDQLGLELTLTRYCMELFRNYEKVFLKIMAVLLKDIDDFTQATTVLWSNIIEVIALEKLDELDFTFHGTGFLNKSVFNQLVVVYNKESLGGFSQSNWFYINNPIVKQRIQIALMESGKEEEQNYKSNKEESEPQIELNIDAIWTKLQQETPLNKNELKREINSCKLLMNDLEETMKIERVIFGRSGEFLKNTLDNAEIK